MVKDYRTKKEELEEEINYLNEDNEMTQTALREEISNLES
jgi:hypothetical protein